MKGKNCTMYLVDLTHSIDSLNEAVCNVLDTYSDSHLYTLKFNLLDHLIQDGKRGGTVQLLCSFAWKRYSMYMKGSHRLTLMPHSSCMKETAKKIGRRSTPENSFGPENVADRSSSIGLKEYRLR